MIDWDYHKQEKLAAWNQRLVNPVFSSLEGNYQELLPLEFVGKLNPESYHIPDEAIALLLCSDERLNNLDLPRLFNGQRQGKSIFPLRLPGAVVGQDIGKLKQKLKSYNFYKLAAASHADCGAAALDLKQKDLKITVDRHAQNLVSNLDGIDNWGFIDVSEDPKLNQIHTASCLLVDGTGKRNYKPDGVLPDECFVVSRAFYSDDGLARSHIKVLTNIALGHHGIGLKNDDQEFGFSPEHPFYIFVAGSNEESLRRYCEEAEDLLTDFPKGSVRIIGFLAPKVD